ncbi:hypothetical protein F441_18351 [Phytophthora nicotianae CJ01A1]|uniref:Uncharacterized protein n=2 Tax=Phytophthora nicotianae TaxID=4792 RepID=W2W2Z1_PHYNI|nr:hypothetical protein F441_18351 [Phytophthora nicotianae CJ01A1]
MDRDLKTILDPWCQALNNRISVEWMQNDRDVWCQCQRRLVVKLPERGEGAVFTSGEEEDALFKKELRRVREALALLEIVRQVSYDVWRNLLEDSCGVRLGQNGEGDFEASIPFELVLDLNPKDEDCAHHLSLILFCGNDQWNTISPEYSNALGEIGRHDHRLTADLDIVVNVRAIIASSFNLDYFSQVCGSVMELPSRRETRQNEVRRLPHCIFVLQPMIADFSKLVVDLNVSETMAKWVKKGTLFSQLSVRVEIHPDLNEQDARVVLGQFMRAVFRLDQRDNERPPAQERWCPSIHLTCPSSLQPVQFEAMCSAIIENKAVARLSISLWMFREHLSKSAHWWKWLAFALFSRQARERSILKSVALMNINKMSSDDVASNLFEDELVDVSYELDNASHTTLKPNACIRLADGCELTLSSDGALTANQRSTNAVGDDNVSEWMTVVIGGYGRCQVKRSDLVFRGNGITSLYLGSNKGDAFESESSSDLSGLPNLLSAVGARLNFLTLDGPYLEMTESEILRVCPNLVNLVVCRSVVEARFNFSRYHENGQQLPQLGDFEWDDIAKLAATLRDKDNPLAQCVVRLRFRLYNMVDTCDRNGLVTSYQDRITSDLDSLLDMLRENETLEYLEISVPGSCFEADVYNKYCQLFRGRQRTGSGNPLLIYFHGSENVTRTWDTEVFL